MRFNFFAGVLLVLASSAAVGGDIVWTGVSSTDWNNSGNWDLARIPGAGDNVVLTGAGANRPTSQGIAGLSVLSITINATATAAITVTGNPVTLTSAATGLSVDPAAGNHTLSIALDMGASQSWSIGAGRTLIVGGVVSGAGLTKTGDGILRLMAANTYTGTTTVAAGIVQVQSVNALGSTAAGTTVLYGAAVEVSGNISVAAEQIDLHGGGTGGGALRSTSGTNTWTGGVGVGSFSCIGADTASQLTVTGAITDIAPAAETGLISYYNFDEAGGPTVVDNSPTARNGAITGLAQRSVGIVGKAMQMTRGNVTVPNYNTVLAPVAPLGEVTVDYWQRMDAVVASSTFTLTPDAVTNRFNAHATWTDNRIYWDFGNINTTGRLSYVPASLLGTWQHITLVSSASGNFMRIYRNGVQESTKAGFSTFTNSQAFNLLLGNTFDGAMDEFRVYNRALSANEIQGLHAMAARGLVKVGVGTVVIPVANSYTAPTAVNAGVLNIRDANALGTAVGATTVGTAGVLEIQSNISVGEPVTLNGTLRNISGSNTWSGALSVAGNGTLNVAGAGDSLTLSNISTPLDSAATGLINYFPFDEAAGATTAVDATGTRNGTINPGATPGVTGVFGRAVQFNGTNGNVAVPTYEAIAPTTEVTIDFWERQSVIKTSSTFNLNPEQVNNRINAHVTWSDGNIYWDFGDLTAGGADNGRLAYNPGNITNVWQHFTFISSKTGGGGTGTMQIYRNGVLEATKTGAAGIFNPAGSPSGYALQIGGNVNYFSGFVDEFRVYNRALSVAEIQALQFNTGVVSLTKTGPGTVVISGAQTYAGAMNVNAGALRVTGSISNSLVTVNNTGTLTGPGSVGRVTVNSGGIVAPGNGPGTLSTRNVSLTASAVLSYELNSTPNPSDLLAVAGNLVLDGIINVVSVPGAGTYPIMTYTGTLTDNGLTVGSVPGGLSSRIDTLTPGVVSLVLGVSGGTATWDGGGGADTNWTTAANWVGDTVPFNGDAIVIGTGGNTVTVNITAIIGSLTLNRAADMAINGPGVLSIGSGGITMSTASNTTIAAPIDLSAAQTWTQNGAGTLFVNGNVTGAFALTKAGTGVLQVGGKWTYTGSTTVSAGTLRLATPTPQDVLTGLTQWLDASRINGAAPNPANGTPISTWTDVSGTGNNATQGNAALQPLFFAAGGPGGRPTVRFDGADDYFNFPRINTMRTIFMVLKEDPAASLTYRFLLGDDTTYHFHRGDTGQFYHPAFTDPGLQTGTLRVNGVVTNGLATNIPRVNSYISISTTNNVQANLLSNDRLIPGRTWWGDVAEVLIYDRALTNTERDRVESYLALKYGIGQAPSLPATAMIVAAGATLDISSVDQTFASLNGAGNVAANSTLTVGDATASTFSGVISGATCNVTKVGTGALTLSGANTYGGMTRVNAGSIMAATPTALGATTAGTIVNVGAAVVVQGSTAIGAEPLAISGTGITNTGALRSAGGINSWAGPVAAGGSIGVDPTSELTISGVISDNYVAYFPFNEAAGSVTAADQSVNQFLGSVNSGCTFVPGIAGNGVRFNGTNGIVSIPNFGAFAPNTDCTVDFWQNVDAVKQQFTFSMTPDDVLNRFASHSPWSDGIVYWDHGNINATGRVSGLPPTSLAGSWQRLTMVNSVSGNYMRIFQNGVQMATRTGAGTFVANASTFQIGGFGTAFFGGVVDEFKIFNRALSDAEVTAGVQISLTKIGTGTLILSGANTYIGSTLISAGTLKLGNPAVIPDTSSVTVTGTLDLNGKNETINALNGAGLVTNSMATPCTLTFGQNNGGPAGTFSGIIQDGSGVVSLVKSGNGDATLSSNNTFTGSVTVTGANSRLIVAHANALGATSGGVTVQSGATLATNLAGANTFSETLTLNGTGVGNNGALVVMQGNVNWNAAVSLATDASVSQVVAGTTLNFQQPVSGAGGLTKLGVGTLVLSAAQTYGGATTVSTGTLQYDGTFTSTQAANVNIGTLIPRVGGIQTGNATFLNPGVLRIRIPDTTNAAKLNVTGNATIAAASTLAIDLSGYPDGQTSQFVVLESATRSGTFGLVPVVNDGGAAENVRAAYRTGGAGEWVVVTINNNPPIANAGTPQTVNEGTTVNVSGSFTDPNALDTHTEGWTVSASNGQVVAPGSGANFSFVPNDNGTYTLTYTVTDSNGGVGTSQVVITVNNVAPVAASFTAAPAAVDEGVATPVIVTVNGPSDAAGDLAAGLHYAYDFDDDSIFDQGDGTYLGSVASASVQVPAVYLQDGPLNLDVTVRVLDKDGASNEYTTTIVIDNVSPTANFVNDGPVIEGNTAQVSFTSQFDASPVDAGSLRFSFDFDNNGTFEVGGASYATASNIPNATVPASYLADGPATRVVHGRIFDKDGGFSDYTTTITINNVAPIIDSLSATTITEGSASTLTINFTDPGLADSYTIDIVWGDSLTDSFALASNGSSARSVSYQHIYVDDPAGAGGGAFNISVTVTDDDDDAGSSGTTVTINNADPVVTIPAGLAPVTPEHASTGSFKIAEFMDAGAIDTHNVTIDWGDGSITDSGSDVTIIIDEPSLANNWTGSVFASHLYDDGTVTYPVAITVTDDDAGVGATGVNVIVQNVPPTALFRRPDAGSFSPLTAVEFVNQDDVSDADDVAGFLYSYDFNNDGIFEITLSTSATAAVPPQFVSAAPNHTVRGRIIDKDGGATDYLLQQPYFLPNPLIVEFDLGSPSSYTIQAFSQPGSTYSLVVVDLPSGVPDLAAVGLSFNGVATISGTPLVAGLLNLRVTALNEAGSATVDLLIYIKRSGGTNTPRIISAPVANPNPVIAGTPTEFSVVAIDENGEILSYYWDFGDGTSARGRVVTHIYNTPGNYVAQITVANSAKTQGDQLNVTVANGGENTFDVQQAKITFDFRKPEKSTLYITGFLPIPSGPLSGVTASVVVIGSLYQQNFILNTAGAGGDTMSLFSVKTIQTGSGINRAKFVFSLKSTNGLDPLNPSLFQKLTSLGYVNSTIERQGRQIDLPLSIKVGAVGPFFNTVPTIYKVALNRTGKATFKRK